MAKPIVLAYRTAWNEADLPPAKVNYKTITHIAHSFAVADKMGLRFPEAKGTQTLIETAHKNGVQVTLAIGGAESNAALSALCATPAQTVALAKAVAKHVNALGYDGADVDWEHPENAADTKRLSAFVAALRAELPRPKLLTMAVPSTDWSGRWYDAPAILPHLDWAAVMSYDFFGPWGNTAGHHAALFAGKGVDPALSGTAAIAYWRDTKRFPASKLLLGIPLYARGFRTKNWGDTVTTPADKNQEGTYRALKAGTTHRDTVCATWETESGAVILSGDNPETAQIKGAWARKQALAGVFFWELSQDGDGKTLPSVIVAAARGFGK
ncbi:MAG: glycoside hydrolase family 18 protein [Armatimonadetes bacterium]|nr:glycoside hydrolase family 18 protein [Armatimonadota bacterium]